MSLPENCPNTEFFLVRIFPHSDWIRRDTEWAWFSCNYTCAEGLKILVFVFDQCSHHIETSQLICKVKQPTGFYIMGTLVVKGLFKNSIIATLHELFVPFLEYITYCALVQNFAPILFTLYKKMKFQLLVSSVNVTKSAGNFLYSAKFQLRHCLLKFCRKYCYMIEQDRVVYRKRERNENL